MDEGEGNGRYGGAGSLPGLESGSSRVPFWEDRRRHRCGGNGVVAVGSIATREMEIKRILVVVH